MFISARGCKRTPKSELIKMKIVQKVRVCIPQTGLVVTKLFSCSTQLSMKFRLLIQTKTFLAFKLSDVVFIMLINVKISTIVGI